LWFWLWSAICSGFKNIEIGLEITLYVDCFLVAWYWLLLRMDDTNILRKVRGCNFNRKVKVFGVCYSNCGRIFGSNVYNTPQFVYNNFHCCYPQFVYNNFHCCVRLFGVSNHNCDQIVYICLLLPWISKNMKKLPCDINLKPWTDVGWYCSVINYVMFFIYFYSIAWQFCYDYSVLYTPETRGIFCVANYHNNSSKSIEYSQTVWLFF